MQNLSPIEQLGAAWIAGALLTFGTLVGIFFRRNKES